MIAKRLKRPRDPVELGKLIGDILTGQVEDSAPAPAGEGKNPAAVALGRLGGLKGGKARAAKLTPKQREECLGRPSKCVGQLKLKRTDADRLSDLLLNRYLHLHFYEGYALVIFDHR